MSEADTARKIGAASKNKDMQFAAKFWDDVPDSNEAKRELLSMARAVDASSVIKTRRAISGINIGDWFEFGGYYRQVVYILLPTGGYVYCAYFKKELVAAGVIETYTVEPSSPSTVLGWTRLPKAPF